MIEHLVKEINTCLKNDLQIAALTMALTLPDTCGKAYCPKGRNGERYANWYDDFITTPKRKQCGIDGAVIGGRLVYKLRCAMLHESNPRVDGGGRCHKILVDLAPIGQCLTHDSGALHPV